ncbi:MAG: glycosyltransferase family 4 protein [Ferruginibacter sp.]
MRIAFVTYEFPPDTGKGGIGTYTSQVAKSLAEIGCDVHVFAGSGERRGTEKMEGYQIHRIQCENGNDFRHKVVNIFSGLHSSIAFDVIESAEINGNAWEIKKKHPSIPLVVRLHAPNYLVEMLKKRYVSFFAKFRFVAGAVRRLKFDLGYWQPYNKWIDADYQFIGLADFISAPSEAMKNWVVNHWGIPRNKITVIPNVFLPPSALLDIPVVEKPLYQRILFFGRLNVLKGLVNATKAMKKILKAQPDWKFRVIGDDGAGPTFKMSMRNWMKQQLKEVINQVEFIDGLVYEDLPLAIAEAEIVLLPSLFESFSYTCAEAMAAGKAVVGSNNAGMADLIQNGISGILVNPNNYHDIYSAIKKLIVSNGLRHQIAINAREHISVNFKAKLIALEFKAFYEHIIENRIEKN